MGKSYKYSTWDKQKDHGGSNKGGKRMVNRRFRRTDDADEDGSGNKGNRHKRYTERYGYRSPMDTDDPEGYK